MLKSKKLLLLFYLDLGTLFNITRHNLTRIVMIMFRSHNIQFCKNVTFKRLQKKKKKKKW